MSRRRFDDWEEDSVDERDTLTRRGRRQISYSERLGDVLRQFQKHCSIQRLFAIVAIVFFVWSAMGLFTYIRHHQPVSFANDASNMKESVSLGELKTDSTAISSAAPDIFTPPSGSGTPILVQTPSSSVPHASTSTPTMAAPPTSSGTRSGSTFKLVEKHSRERASDVLSAEKQKFCTWWDTQKRSLSHIARQVTGDLVTFLLNLNFEFSDDKHEYIKQLEEWRQYVLMDKEPQPRYNADGSIEPSLYEPITPTVKAKCRSKCAFSINGSPQATEGDARVYDELMKTHAYRQTLVKCMLCVQGHVHLHDKCHVRDETKHIARRLAPNRIREAFDRIYDRTDQHVPHLGPDATIDDLKTADEARKEHEPFFLGAGVAAAFAPYLSLLDTFTYAPDQLPSVFPLPDRESQVDITAFREQSSWLAKQSRAIRTETDAGMGGGMGVQLICKPHKNAEPLLLMSSGGGGGRGFQMNVDPLSSPREARVLGRAADIIANAPPPVTTNDALLSKKQEAEHHYGKDFAAYHPECCNSRVHTCCGGAIHFEEEDNKDEGLLFRARGRSAQDQNEIKREIHAGLGGGGGIQVSFGPDPITHQVRADHDLNLGGGGGGGAAIINNDYSESHGSQKDTGILIPDSFPEFRKRLFRDILHCVAHADALAAQPELWIVGGGGMGLGVRMDLKTSSNLSPQLFSSDDQEVSPKHSRYAKVSISADAGMGFKLKLPQAWITSFPIPHLAPLRSQVPNLVETSQDTNPQQSPAAQEEGLFDSATSLATASAQCVDHCLDLQGSALTQHHSDVLAPHLHTKLTSTGTQSSHSLFYAHCVCPCLQKSFSRRHWAGYMACTPLAIGTYDVATSGHVAVADVVRAPHSEKAQSSLVDHGHMDDESHAYGDRVLTHDVEH